MFLSVQMNNGKVLEGEKIEELVNYVINKFSEEKLTHDEAEIILDRIKENIGEYSIITSVNVNNPENNQQ